MYIKLDEYPGYRFIVTPDSEPSPEAQFIANTLEEVVWFVELEQYIEGEGWESTGAIIGDTVAPNEIDLVQYLAEDLVAGLE